MVTVDLVVCHEKLIGGLAVAGDYRSRALLCIDTTWGRGMVRAKSELILSSTLNRRPHGSAARWDVHRHAYEESLDCAVD